VRIADLVSNERVEGLAQSVGRVGDLLKSERVGVPSPAAAPKNATQSMQDGAHNCSRPIEHAHEIEELCSVPDEGRVRREERQVRVDLGSQWVIVACAKRGAWGKSRSITPQKSSCLPSQH
jgi:hypothetical protein